MKKGKQALLGLSLSAFLAACTASAFNPNKTTILTVSVASSLQDAIKAIGKEYENQTQNVTIVYNFGSSGSLQQQIEQGAPVDIFISASPKQMDALESKGLLQVGTRKDLLKNQLVLVVPKGMTEISEFKDLTKDGVKNIAIGHPESVPAGQYAKEVLTALNLYETIEEKLVFTKNVRQVLSYVETGNVDAGLVYATDAKLSDRVQVIQIASDVNHSPIIYPAAILKETHSLEDSLQFIDFFSTPKSTDSLTRYGFDLID